MRTQEAGAVFAGDDIEAMLEADDLMMDLYEFDAEALMPDEYDDGHDPEYFTSRDEYWADVEVPTPVGAVDATADEFWKEKEELRSLRGPFGRGIIDTIGWVAQWRHGKAKNQDGSWEAREARRQARQAERRAKQVQVAEKMAYREAAQRAAGVIVEKRPPAPAAEIPVQQRRHGKAFKGASIR
ncbi:MAG TPA: hypothetical protein VG604_01095 [Candidatus Saccharimonadales bacterium]|nr:hypothetical protein [Candidatus Saccharimonadales bacterium]